ncbi:PAS domain-containing protein [Streptomyces sp. NPDC050619]|uniref:PAS domain-containing protein n=1 Tax=Streptomyces sp. NPDC050619 TaxID=3157214 RepID=UPI003412C031
MGFDRLPLRWLFAGAEDVLLSALADAPGEAVEQAHEYGILRSILDSTSASVAVMDQQLRYRYVNAAMARMGGVPPSAFHGRTMAGRAPSRRAWPVAMVRPRPVPPVREPVRKR